jgi:predicted nucleic acid-binding protein
MSVVVDASVAAKWLMPEPDSDKAEALLLRWQRKSIDLAAPRMISIEIANVLWKRAFRGLISPIRAARLYDDFDRLGLPLESTDGLVAPALELALQYGHSVYDGLYLVLALNLGWDLMTSDERLYRKVSPAFSQVRLLRDWA